MNDRTQLVLALMQIENLISLLSTNSYSGYFHSRLIQIKYELQRQLSLEINI